MTEEDDLHNDKFSAFRERGKELLNKSIEVTKDSSKSALEFGKKITEDGISQAKEGLNSLNQKKEDYIARKNAKTLERSRMNALDEGNSGPASSKKDQSAELDLIQEQMKQIEHEFPTVLNEPVPRKRRIPKKNIWARILASTLLFSLAILTIIHTLAPYLDSELISLVADVLAFILPSWLSNPTTLFGFSDWPLILGTATTIVLVLTGVLTLFNSPISHRLLWVYYGGFLCIGQLVFRFYGDSGFEFYALWDFFRDALKTLVVVGIAKSPSTVKLLNDSDDQPTIFEYSGILGIKGNISNTSDDLEVFIEEGLKMDFRTEVAKPKPPRARAKFEGYEVILLCVSFVLWPVTILMTMAFDGGLSPYMDYSSGPMQVGAVWALSLLTLIALVRFDRSARGNGWYAKEKETYVGMMDLYSKAQAKHYEYVELRAAAEAQEILEKYPQLDKTVSGRSSNA